MSAHNKTPNVTAADTVADTTPLPAATFREAVNNSPAASPAKKVTHTEGAEDTSWVLPPNHFNAPWKSPGAQHKTSGAGTGNRRNTGPSSINTAALTSAMGLSPQVCQSQSPTLAQCVKEIEMGHHESDLEDGEIPEGNPLQHELDDESDDLTDYIKFPLPRCHGLFKAIYLLGHRSIAGTIDLPAALSPTPDPDSSRTVAAAEFNAKMADMPAPIKC
ncbi:hypothetical protein B0H17DRAFT_1208140 [Mycena rosella]|uniref:Uncharacterized protein n=1 Tax=Mycena rosella TaxID=1033263 RepID=A0AAD7G7D2_MYCRO|nr:hypothetical protein B0H17DRAFT_1208140 [Mycena rosella]